MQLEIKQREKMKRRRALQLILFLKVSMIVGLVAGCGVASRVWKVPFLWAVFCTGHSLQVRFDRFRSLTSCFELLPNEIVKNALVPTLRPVSREIPTRRQEILLCRFFRKPPSERLFPSFLLLARFFRPSSIDLPVSELRSRVPYSTVRNGNFSLESREYPLRVHNIGTMNFPATKTRETNGRQRSNERGDSGEEE